MSGHTPGPWAIAPRDTNRRITDTSGHSVCVASRRPDSDANTRLIVAAPDMLAALQAAREQLREAAASFSALGHPVAMERQWNYVRAIDATIAKAEGKA